MFDSRIKRLWERTFKSVDQLYNRLRVKLVYVGEIQTRDDFRYGLTKKEFDQRRRVIINGLLSAGEGMVRQVLCGVQGRFPDYDADLVHMDMSEKLRPNSGMRKYQYRRIFCSYRNIL